jgi:hypothetical protein
MSAVAGNGPAGSGWGPEPTFVESGDGLVFRALPAAVAATAIVWLGPFFAWPSPLYFRVSVLLTFVFFVVALGTGRIGLGRANVALAALLLLLMLYFAAHPRGRLYDPSTGWLAMVVFLVLDERGKAASHRIFVWAFALSLVPAIVVWVLSLAGADLPWSYLYAKRLDADLLIGTEGAYYRHYLGSVVRNNQVIDLGFGSLFRLHGVYEEAGLVGTIAGLLLVAGRFRLRARPENMILLAGGLMSFSLAFMAIAYGYLVVRRPAWTLFVTVLAIAAGTALDLPDRVPLLRVVLLDRLAPGGGAFIGDYRMTALWRAMYQDFWESDSFTRLFGSGLDSSTLVDTGTFSYQVLIYQYGVVGFGAVIAVLSSALIAVSRRKDALLLLGFVLLSIYQRPNVLTLPYLVILLGGAAQLRETVAALETETRPVTVGELGAAGA